MCAHKLSEASSAGSRIEAVLAWLGGGDRRELAERHERSSHAIAGMVVLLQAALAWLVATVAIAGSTHWPTPAILPLTLVFGLLVGAVTRALATGRVHGRPGIVARASVAVAVGVVVGELAALAIFSGAIDRRLDEQAARNADSTASVVQATADRDRTRAARTALDDAVEQARARRDEALVVARCEYNPTPACPQTRITGVPGVGPETRTANELLVGAQQELDNALSARDLSAPQLDAKLAGDERALGQARQGAVAKADRGLGARWVAMYERTFASGGALLLHLLTIAFFALLSLLPLILQRWRGETSHDRSAAARAERDRAELDADTAIAVKRAQVRAEAETLWAEQQLAKTRLAVEAQTEIDRAQYRRRVAEALHGPVRARAQRQPEPVENDFYLPIAAEAEAASRAAAELPVGQRDSGEDRSQNLPAPIEPSAGARPRGEAPLVPTVPDVARAAARWIRPLVPPFVARAIGTTTQPLRAARQVFEEVEEIRFSLKRTHRVTVHSEERSEEPRRRESLTTDTKVDARRGESSAAGAAVVSDHGGLDSPRSSFGITGREVHPELTEPEGPRELPNGPSQLPPAE